jgi:hypothetical protein
MRKRKADEARHRKGSLKEGDGERLMRQAESNRVI